VVGQAPGAGTDLVARSVGQKLSESLGQSVVVNNRTGAVGSIRAGIFAKSPPDGYIVLIVCEQLLDYPSFYQRLPFDPLKDHLERGAPFLVMVNRVEKTMIRTKNRVVQITVSSDEKEVNREKGNYSELEREGLALYKL
jgi:hypothetical protein